MANLQARTRIKQEGPLLEDLVLSAEQDYLVEAEVNRAEDEGLDQEEDLDIEVETKTVYEWVPPQVMGTGFLIAEPPWHKLKRMDFLTFYVGVQKRNWTSQYYDENAMPWKLAFYKVRRNIGIHRFKVMLSVSYSLICLCCKRGEVMLTALVCSVPFKLSLLRVGRVTLQGLVHGLNPESVYTWGANSSMVRPADSV